MKMNEYLTPEELKQMEELMKKAVERRGNNSGTDDSSLSFMLWKFKYEGKAKQADEEKIKKNADFEKDLKSLMEHACRFCQRNGYCEDRKKLRIYDEDDEELPFDISTDNDECSDEKAEFQRYFQSGRMSMLFELVDKGTLTLDEAAGIANMTWGEAEDMLRGWQIAQNM